MESSSASIEILQGGQSLHHAYLAPAVRTARSTLPADNQGIRFSSEMCIDATTTPVTLRVDGSPVSAATAEAIRANPYCPADSYSSSSCGQSPTIFSSRPLATALGAGATCADLRDAWSLAAVEQPLAPAKHCDGHLNASLLEGTARFSVFTVCEGQAAVPTATFVPAPSAARLTHHYQAGQGTLVVDATDATMACVAVDGSIDLSITGNWTLDLSTLGTGRHDVDILMLGATRPPTLRVVAPSTTTGSVCTQAHYYSS